MNTINLMSQQAENLSKAEANFVNTYLQVIAYLKKGLSLEELLNKIDIDIQLWEEYYHLVPYQSNNMAE